MRRAGLHILAASIVLYILGVFAFLAIGETPWVDKLSASNIAISFILCGIVVLIFTEEWLWRRAGAMIAILGAGIGYLYISGVAWDFFAQNQALSKALLRSAFNVGGTLFTLGILRWGYDRWRTRHREPIGLLDDDRS